jgi:hypothetical protein
VGPGIRKPGIAPAGTPIAEAFAARLRCAAASIERRKKE